MRTIAFFNNKGGVGKTSLAYNLSWMFADLGRKVVAVDLDPQSNLTSSFLNDDQLEALWEPTTSGGPRTLLGTIQPLLDRMGDVVSPPVVEVDDHIGLVPGDLGLSLFEDRLADTWGKCLDDNSANANDAFRVTTAFYRIMAKACEKFGAEIVLVDVGPNLGAINRSALVAADHVVIPLAADLYSLQGLRNLGPTLRTWRAGWSMRRSKAQDMKILALPRGGMAPVGYVVMQPSMRENYPVKAYRKWIGRIPGVYHAEVLGDTESFVDSGPDQHALATLKNYRSLAPMAQDARKPMFALKPADGAIGGHVAAVGDCYRVFRDLALRIAGDCGIAVPENGKARSRYI